MKVYLIGSKKTGIDLSKKIPAENLLGSTLCGDIDWEMAKKADCIWFFADQEQFTENLENFLDIRTPMIINLPLSEQKAVIDGQLKVRKKTWIYGPRICLGMNLVSPFIEYLSKSHLFWNNIETQIQDIAAADEPHDPSPMAREWADAIDTQATILTDRISSNPGVTKINLSTKNESLELSHRINDREAYIQGALWATYKIGFSNQASDGLIRFEKLFWQTQTDTHIMGPDTIFQA